MAKLYFRYGAMGCGKTRDIIKVWYNYKEKGKNAIIIKPGIDTKGNDKIVSRDNSELNTDYLIKKEDNIYDIISKHKQKYNLDCILVDEAQFLDRHHVEELTDICDDLDITVMCYGLRADFQDNLFPGSAALFAYADVIEEMKTICECMDGATRNVRFINGEPVFEGSQVAIDGKDKVTYVSMCRKCRKKLVKDYNKKYKVEVKKEDNIKKKIIKILG